MAVDKAEIRDIAWLARLAVKPDELEQYQKDLETLLELVEQLQHTETGAVKPLAHPFEIPARLRADEVTETNQRERFQAIAPAVDKGHFLVPRVIE